MNDKIFDLLKKEFEDMAKKADEDIKRQREAGALENGRTMLDFYNGYKTCAETAVKVIKYYRGVSELL